MTRERKFTGWHALAIFGISFGIIIAVNITLAWNAIRTFPGLETPNSYVASQSFDARRSAQEALAWTVEAKAEGGLVRVTILDRNGDAVQVSNLHAVLGRPTHVGDDHEPEFNFDGTAYVARDTLAPGNWNIRMTAQALDGTRFQQRVVLYVKG